MPSAHAPPDILAAYADGSLSEGMSLLVASHLTFCPDCRAAVARLEALGGALLAEGEAVAPTAGCLEAALARLAAPEPGRPAPDPVFPLPLVRRLGAGSDGIRWRSLMPGVAACQLDGFEGEDVSLMRARPGVRVPAHSHCGREATLVLAGAMRDGARVFGRGDVALADKRHEHGPEIVGEAACICLMVLTGEMRFTGLFGWALNRLSR